MTIRGARGRRRRAGRQPRRAGRRADAAVPPRPRPADGRHRRRGARREPARRRTRPRPNRRSARSPSTRAQTAIPARREVAQALGGNQVRRGSAQLLVPLMYDPAREVAEEAIRSAGRLGATDYLFVAAAALADAQPAAQGRRAGGARRLRRGHRRDARLLPARRGRGHLGAPAHPVDARAHPDAAVGGRAARGARRSRRVPALQGAAARSAACGASTPSW